MRLSVLKSVAAAWGVILVSLPLLGCEGEPIVPPEKISVPVPAVMISVPAGAFEMGRPYPPDADWKGGSYQNETPVHSVTLSAYEIGKYEVTNQEYADMLNWANGQGYLDKASSSTATAYGHELLGVDANDEDVYGGTCHVQFSAGVFSPKKSVFHKIYSVADHPVILVSWYGAAAYCNWLSEIEGLTPCYDTSTWECNSSNNGYHLPTEAQWERAAAWDGSKHWRYGNGSDSISGLNANYAISDPLNISQGGRCASTSPAGWFDGMNVIPNGPRTVDSPSPVGCYDMSGNVWEWCNDWCDSSYYSRSPSSDPQGPSSGSERVFRGGCWINPTSDSCRSAWREGMPPSESNILTGFRLAR